VQFERLTLSCFSVTIVGLLRVLEAVFEMSLSYSTNHGAHDEVALLVSCA
jgi:hypothetical protein